MAEKRKTNDLFESIRDWSAILESIVLESILSSYEGVVVATVTEVARLHSFNVGTSVCVEVF